MLPCSGDHSNSVQSISRGTVVNSDSGTRTPACLTIGVVISIDDSPRVIMQPPEAPGRFVVRGTQTRSCQEGGYTADAEVFGSSV